MRTRLNLSIVMLLVAGSAASAQSLTAGYTGTVVVNSTAANTGNMFDVAAFNASGITITSFDIHCRLPAGEPIFVEVYTRPASFVGFETDPSAWTLHGAVPTVTGGAGQATPLPVGDLFIPSGQTHGIYINIVTAEASVRYNNALTTPTEPVANADAALYVNYSAAKSGLFGGTFTPRGFNGAIHYDVGNTITNGACCLPSGSCAMTTATSCLTQEGTFRGDGTDCATSPPCPQPGACCLRDGTCTILSEVQCDSMLGTYNGPNTDCSTIMCPQPGACCLPDGTCELISGVECNERAGVFQGSSSDCFSNPCPGAGACCLPDGHCLQLSEAGCTANGGAFEGVGTFCQAGLCPQPLFANGPIITGEGQGFSFANISRVDMSTIGSTVTQSGTSAHFRLADNFTVPDPEGWTVNSLMVYGYVTGSYPFYPAMSPWTGGHVNIWDGIPGEIGSNIVATSSTMEATGFTGVYRITETGSALATDRPIMYVTVGFSAVHLPAGDYWMDYQLAAPSTGFASYVTDLEFGLPVTRTGNARQLTATGWVEVMVPANDPNAQTVEFPFAIVGQIGGTVCYANCDGSTVQPILNVDDFTCFINSYAAAQSLPHAQQITAYANCDGSTIAPVLNVDDFTCFINEYAAGCP